MSYTNFDQLTPRQKAIEVLLAIVFIVALFGCFAAGLYLISRDYIDQTRKDATAWSPTSPTSSASASAVRSAPPGDSSPGASSP